MNSKNVSYIKWLLSKLQEENIRFISIDERWQEERENEPGDIDIIVNKLDKKRFHKFLVNDILHRTKVRGFQ